MGKEDSTRQDRRDEFDRKWADFKKGVRGHMLHIHIPPLLPRFNSQVSYCVNWRNKWSYCLTLCLPQGGLWDKNLNTGILFWRWSQVARGRSVQEKGGSQREWVNNVGHWSSSHLRDWIMPQNHLTEWLGSYSVSHHSCPSQVECLAGGKSPGCPGREHLLAERSRGQEYMHLTGAASGWWLWAMEPAETPQLSHAFFDSA